jgi:hypothetical protein
MGDNHSPQRNASVAGLVYKLYALTEEEIAICELASCNPLK